MKLSRVQQTALDRLKEEFAADPRKWFSAYELRQGLPTLRALNNAGLIERKSPPGFSGLMMPRSSVLFRYKGE